jgi:hypothetical protein
MRSSYTYRLFALALFFLAAPCARADQISWSYDFSTSSSSVQANVATADNAHVEMSTLSGTLTGTLPTSATITAVNLQAISSASTASAAQFKDAEYTLTMQLTDLSSGLKAAVTFEGILNGTVSASGTSLKNEFIGQTEFSFDLNHHVYAISIGDFKAPGAPGSGDLGSISVEISIHHNPEPSSLLLGVLGFPALAYLRRRRRASR